MLRATTVVTRCLPRQALKTTQVGKSVLFSAVGPRVAVFAPLRASFATTASFNQSLKACEEAKDHVKAVELVEEMKAAGVARDLESYRSAIIACANAKQWDKAYTLIQSMDAEGIKPEKITHESVIAKAIEQQQWERAIDCLEEMMVFELPKPPFVSLKNALAAAGETEKAEYVGKLEREGLPEEDEVDFGPAEIDMPDRSQ